VRTSREGDVPGENTSKGMNCTERRLSAGESCQTLTATGYGFARDVYHFRPVSECRDGLITTVRLDLA
jgi:hypothetical protein